MKFIYSKIAGFFILLSICQGLSAESFRVHQLIPLRLSASESSDVSAGMNDAIAITLPDDMTYISGIELTVKIPTQIAEWPDSVAYSLYEGISPKPTPKNIDYSGNRSEVKTFPARLSTTIYIPLSKKFTIKNSPYSVRLKETQAKAGESVFFRMQLAMKGVPESFDKAKFQITAKAVLADEGRLSISISDPTGKKGAYSLFIDDKPVAIEKDGILLASGEHSLSVQSEVYRNEVRSFRIDKAKTTKLEVALRGIEPLVKISAPQNAKIFFDGNEVSKKVFTTTPGEHSVKFTVGDYEVVKNLNAQNGRSYTVTLNVDASVSEE